MPNFIDKYLKAKETENSQIIYGEKMLSSVEDILRGKITFKDDSQLEEVAFIILSNFTAYSEIYEEDIDKILDSYATVKFDRCVSSVFNGLMKEERKKGPVSQKKRRELRSRSFAICTAQLPEEVRNSDHRKKVKKVKNSDHIKKDKKIKNSDHREEDRKKKKKKKRKKAKFSY